MDDKTELIRKFNELFYYGINWDPIFENVTFLGVKALKCPLDLWIYQEILYRTRPEVIIECGVFHGGTTLYLATLCDLMGIDRVIAVDRDTSSVDSRVKYHSRVHLVHGDSTDPAIYETVKSQCQGRRTMVILDSNHERDHVLKELKLYGPLVSYGCYLICEDTNVNGNPVLPDYGPGPMEAVQAFLAESKGWKVDTSCEKFLVTFHPSGSLLREGPADALKDGEGAEVPWLFADSTHLQLPQRGPGDFDPYTVVATDWVCVLRARVVVELGVRLGVSTRALLDGVRVVGGSVWGVDLRDQHGIVNPRFHFIKADAADVANQWTKIDLLHIDTDPHTEEQTRRWFELYADRCRAIALHDTHHPKFGVGAAVRNFVASGDWVVFEYWGNISGWTILIRKSELPPSWKTRF